MSGWLLRTAANPGHSQLKLWFYRRMLRLSYLDRVTNKEVLQRQLKFLGHIIRPTPPCPCLHHPPIFYGFISDIVPSLSTDLNLNQFLATFHWKVRQWVGPYLSACAKIIMLQRHIIMQCWIWMSLKYNCLTNITKNTDLLKERSEKKRELRNRSKCEHGQIPHYHRCKILLTLLSNASLSLPSKSFC